MSERLFSIVKRVLVILTVFLLTSIFGAISNVSASNDTGPDLETETATRSTDSRGTTIGGYLQLWDYNYYEPHDGTYGDNDGYYYYLDSPSVGFRIYVKSLYTGNRLENIKATLIRPQENSNIFTVTDGKATEYSMYEGDIDSFYFYFKILTNAQIKAYDFSLKFEFTSVNQQSESAEHVGTMDIKIKLSSRIESYGGSSSKLKISAVNKFSEPEPFYAGCKNQLVSIYRIESRSGTLTDVQLKLDPPKEFYMDTKSASLEMVTTSYHSNTYPLWLLESSGSDYENPKEYHGNCDITYKLSGRTVKEADVPIFFEIDQTPMLDYYDQIPEPEIGILEKNKKLANIEVYQGMTHQTFSLNFKNTGNVDLEDVKVELYTDDAEFFFKSGFYYNEGDHASVCAYGNCINLGDVFREEVVKANFPTEFIKNLPPGLYRIPIKYTATYNKGGFVNVNLKETDYHSNIVSARMESGEGYLPFLMVNVLEGDNSEDEVEPDLTSICPMVLQPGMRNVQLSVELMNQECYKLNNVNIQMDVGGDTPLQKLNSNNMVETRIDPIERDFVMYAANDPTFLNKYQVHFIVDIYKDAEIGLHKIPLTITCLDQYNRPRTTTSMLELNIMPIPPRFIISEIDVSKIEPFENFNLTITVHNCGGCDAKNVSIMYNGTSNLFSLLEAEIYPKPIDEDDDFDFRFHFKAGDIEPGTTYSLSFFILYEDEIGNEYLLDSHPQLVVPLTVKKRDPNFAPRLIISDTTTTDIEPNSDFKLQLKLFNSGGSDAKNIRIMFNGSSNLFSAEKKLQTYHLIPKYQEAVFDFDIETGDIDPGREYLSSVHVSYEDTKGKIYSFTANPEQAITLRAQEPEPDEWDINVGLALILLGILIFVSMIIFSIIRSRISKKERETKGESAATENGRVELKKSGTATTVKPKSGGGFFKRKDGHVPTYQRSDTPGTGAAGIAPAPGQQSQTQPGLGQAASTTQYRAAQDTGTYSAYPSTTGTSTSTGTTQTGYQRNYGRQQPAGQDYYQGQASTTVRDYRRHTY